MFKIEFPIVTPTLSVELRNPVFGDILNIENGAIIRTTRSNELKHFKDPTWPNIEINNYPFNLITSSKIGEVRDFLIATAGLLVAINTDHLGQIWHGVILNPVIDFITVRDVCSYDFALVFQGTKQ